MKFLKLAGTVCFILIAVIAAKSAVKLPFGVQDGKIPLLQEHEGDRHAFQDFGRYKNISGDYDRSQDYGGDKYFKEYNGTKGNAGNIERKDMDPNHINTDQDRNSLISNHPNGYVFHGGSVLNHLDEDTGKKTSEEEPEEEQNEGPDKELSGKDDQKDGFDEKTFQFAITVDELKSIEKIGFLDKITGLKIAGKINRNDLKRIIEICRNGVTLSELDTVKSILHANLGQKDIEGLYRILARNKNILSENTADAILSCLETETD